MAPYDPLQCHLTSNENVNLLTSPSPSTSLAGSSGSTLLQSYDALTNPNSYSALPLNTAQSSSLCGALPSVVSPYQEQILSVDSDRVAGQHTSLPVITLQYSASTDSSTGYPVENYLRDQNESRSPYLTANIDSLGLGNSPNTSELAPPAVTTTLSNMLNTTTFSTSDYLQGFGSNNSLSLADHPITNLTQQMRDINDVSYPNSRDTVVYAKSPDSEQLTSFIAPRNGSAQDFLSLYSLSGSSAAYEQDLLLTDQLEHLHSFTGKRLASVRRHETILSNN